MRVILLAWLLLAAAAASAPAQSLPDPGSAGSHEAFLRTLADGKARIARDILARYDQRLARDPSNATAALERCLFLRASFADRNGADRSRYRAEQRTCTDELAARFPVDPDAAVYVIQHRRGSRRTAAAESFLNNPPPGTQARHLAAVHATLATAESDSCGEDAGHAEKAMELDPSLDLRLQIARKRESAGDDDGVRAVLSEKLLETKKPWELQQKAVMLTDAGAFEEALAAFAEVQRRGTPLAYDLTRARALAGSGRIEEALEAYRKSEQTWDDDELLARFRLELEHGNSETARTAYDALTNGGYRKDPLGRHRMALLAAFPDASWKASDALGLLAFAATAAMSLVAPVLVVAPIFLLGRRRDRRRGGAPPASPDGLRLSHAWLAISAILVANVIVYLAYPDAFERAGSQAARPLIARATLLVGLLELAGLVLLARGRIVRMFARGSWGAGRVLGGGVLLLVAMQTAGFLVRYFTGVEPPRGTTTLLRAMDAEWGRWVVMGYVAVLVPWCEEVAFRGIVLPAFRARVSDGLANFAQAAFFGLLHGDVLVASAAFAFGLVAGRMTIRSGSLRAALLGHVLNNSLSWVHLF